MPDIAAGALLAASRVQPRVILNRQFYLCALRRAESEVLRDYPPMINLTAAAAMATGLFIMTGVPAEASPSKQNGTWSVELVTESGPCSARYSYALAIREGTVQLVSGDAGARVNGHVGADGIVGLTVSTGTASGTGTGRLQGGIGAGTWKVASLCSGRWTARRSDTRTAQAE